MFIIEAIIAALRFCKPSIWTLQILVAQNFSDLVFGVCTWFLPNSYVINSEMFPLSSNIWGAVRTCFIRRLPLHRYLASEPISKTSENWSTVTGYGCVPTLRSADNLCSGCSVWRLHYPLTHSSFALNLVLIPWMGGVATRTAPIDFPSRIPSSQMASIHVLKSKKIISTHFVIRVLWPSVSRWVPHSML